MFSVHKGVVSLFKLIIPSVLLVSQYTFSQSVNQELDDYLELYIQNKNVPSLSAGAAKNGRIIWLRTEGFADLENMVPATNRTVYRIASISKSITAVAVMQLVEQGKISLDADVRRYIPYLPQYKWKFTTRQLLSHTSGIRDYRTGEFDSKNFFKTTKDVINYLAKDSLIYEPGTQYRYSTLAYNILSAIIESVSGTTFSEYLKKNIFTPAGMLYTTTELQKELIPNRARGYARDEERKISNAPLADLSIKYPGGGIISTSEDLLKFANSLIQGRLVKTATLDSMLIPTRLKNGRLINYGLGFSFGTDDKGRKYFSHEGGGTGFASLLLVYPTENLATVHLINIRDRVLNNPAKDLAAIVMKEPYDLPKRSFADYLLNLTFRTNIDSAISLYKNGFNDTINYIISPHELLLFGNDLILTERNVDAIKFFKFFLTQFPQNINGYIGLADAYRKDGNIGLAINSYRIVLRMDPLNSYADSMIRKLNGNKN